MNIDKTIRMNELFDFYQSLLTDKQRDYMAYYYLEDFSLAEIAEKYHVSRQAVYDNIRRTEEMLEAYEAQLQLREKFYQRRELIERLKKLDGQAELAAIISSLEALE